MKPYEFLNPDFTPNAIIEILLAGKQDCAVVYQPATRITPPAAVVFVLSRRAFIDLGPYLVKLCERHTAPKEQFRVQASFDTSIAQLFQAMRAQDCNWLHMKMWEDFTRMFAFSGILLGPAFLGELRNYGAIMHPDIDSED